MKSDQNFIMAPKHREGGRDFDHKHREGRSTSDFDPKHTEEVSTSDFDPKHRGGGCTSDFDPKHRGREGVHKILTLNADIIQDCRLLKWL